MSGNPDITLPFVTITVVVVVLLTILLVALF